MSDEIRDAKATRSEYVRLETHFKAVRDELITRWVNTKYEETERRERLHMGVRMLDILQESMIAEISTLAIGEYAEKVGAAVEAA